jgi:hypothetical protein
MQQVDQKKQWGKEPLLVSRDFNRVQQEMEIIAGNNVSELRYRITESSATHIRLLNEAGTMLLFYIKEV